MIEEITDGDVLAVGGKARENLREGFVVAQLVVVDEEHDGHSGKLFGEGSEAEICMRVDFYFRTQIAHPFRSYIEILSAVTN